MHYRHHPLFKRRVPVVGRRRAGALPGVVVGLPDGTRCVLPAWMLDAAVCEAQEEASEPRIDVAALCALVRLVEGQPSCRKLPPERAGAVRPGGRDGRQGDEPAPADMERGRGKLPEAVEEEVRALLAQLLRVVVEAERAGEEAGNE